MCGVGDYTVHLAGAVQALEGMQVGLLAYQSIDPLPAGVQSVNFHGGWGWTAFMKMWRALRGYQADVVHLQYPSLGYPRSLSTIGLALLARLSGVRLVVTLHEPLRWLSLPWFWALVFSARSVVYVRLNYFELLPRFQAWYLRQRPHQLIQNASAVPTSRLDANDQQALRRQYAKDRARLVCYFGFIFPGKGIELLLDVVQPSNDQLVLVGASPDEHYLQQLQQWIEAKGLTDNVQITGMLPAADVADLLACSDAVILPFPSGSGSWNTTVHSALAQGTTVITTTVDEPKHDLQRNIFFVRPGDVKGMRDLLSRYAGRKVAKQSTQHQWQHIACEHVQVYRDLRVTHV
jgi:glycosyltransferase involved in cell wall biosynthesis